MFTAALLVTILTLYGVNGQDERLICMRRELQDRSQSDVNCITNLQEIVSHLEVIDFNVSPSVLDNVCNNESCLNQFVEVLELCSREDDAIESYSRLLCTSHSGSNCAQVLSETEDFDAEGSCIAANRTERCPAGCSQGYTKFVEEAGCCAGEIIEFSSTLNFTVEVYNGFKQLYSDCDSLPVLQTCDGRTILPTSSSATTPPTSSGATTPPTSSGATTPPTSSGATTPPTSSGATTPPTSSSATTPPTSSGAASGWAVNGAVMMLLVVMSLITN